MSTTRRPGGPPKRGADANGPSEVAPGLFVGSWRDATGFEGRRFCVLEEVPEGLAGTVHLPVYDERTGRVRRSNLDRLAREITEARATGAPVLVFCGHGVRRSPLAVAWYLHVAEKIPLAEAFERVRSARPRAEPPSAWLESRAELDGA